MKPAPNFLPLSERAGRGQPCSSS